MSKMLAARLPTGNPIVPHEDPLEALSRVSGEALHESHELFKSILEAINVDKPPSRGVLKQWKRQVKKINLGISKTTREAWKELDRTKIEIETLKINTAHDILDERSNIARVLEKVRTYSNMNEGAVDRALTSTAAVQSMMGSLTSTPETSFHGAALLYEDVRCNHDSLDAVLSETAGTESADAKV